MVMKCKFIREPVSVRRVSETLNVIIECPFDEGFVCESTLQTTNIAAFDILKVSALKSPSLGEKILEAVFMIVIKILVFGWK